MYKIKLLISSLILSAILFSCSSNKQAIPNSIGFSVDYIAGELDGLQLKNYLIAYLDGYGMYNAQSKLSIKANIDHSGSVYITNIDNTSDRNKITSNLSIKIYDMEMDCLLYEFNKSSAQFYLVASSQNYLSNNAALAKIKKDNLDYLIKKFINEVKVNSLSCQ